jgi:hypothetical protein
MLLSTMSVLHSLDPTSIRMNYVTNALLVHIVSEKDIEMKLFRLLTFACAHYSYYHSL